MFNFINLTTFVFHDLKVKSNTEEFLKRVAAIAFTDSMHEMHDDMPKKFIKFCRKVSLFAIVLFILLYC